MTAADAHSPLAGLSPAEHRRAENLFVELFRELEVIGLAEDGSSTRLAWSAEAQRADEWFDRTAKRLGLTPRTDNHGNRWAWSHPAEAGAAILTGSHLDTVPRGGRYDGALGVVSGLIATSIVLERARVGKPLGVVSFADEEGGRFNTPTFGSRLLVGALAPDAVLDRVDGDGISLSDAIIQAGLRPESLGRDASALARIDSFVELHIEQGTLLSEHDQPIGLATSILPHGRWRIDLFGETNHGGTTAMAVRRDPMPALAEVLQAGRRLAHKEGALVTVGKIDVWPNAPTSIAERVSAWLDVRSELDDSLDRVVDEITGRVRTIASEHGVQFRIEAESRTGEIRFSEALAERITQALGTAGIAPVPTSTGAGHDAGVLAAQIPTAMLFVRNQTGISHGAAELAGVEDCVSGIGALATVLDELRTETPTNQYTTDGTEAGRT